MSIALQGLADHDADLALPTMRARRTGRLQEVVFVAAGLAALLAAQVALIGPRVLLARPFWLDELFTALPATDPSVAHAVRAVRSGLDTNPPVLHLLMGALCRLTGARPEIVFRVAALAFVWLGLVAAYATLRRSFGMLASLAAVLAVWMHPLVQEHAFEGRFYAPLLAGLAWVALGLGLGGRTGVIVTAAAAGFTGSLHHFGAALVGCVALGELALGCGRFAERFLRIAPTIAAPLSIMPFLPFIHDQSAGLAMRTWLAKPHFPDIDQGLRLLAFPYPLMIVLLAAWLSPPGAPPRGKERERADDAAADDRRRSLPASASLLGLLVFPIILLAFSKLIQPVFSPRYLTPVVLALAPLVALGMSLAGRRGQLAAVAVMAVLGPVFLRSTSWALAAHGQIVNAVAALARADAQPYPMLFPNSHVAFELWRYAPDLRPRIHVLDSRPLGTAVVPARFYYDLDQHAKTETMYDLPRMCSLDELRTGSIVRLAGAPPDVSELARILPVKAMPGGLFEVTAGPNELHQITIRAANTEVPK